MLSWKGFSVRLCHRRRRQPVSHEMPPRSPRRTTSPSQSGITHRAVQTTARWGAHCEAGRQRRLSARRGQPVRSCAAPAHTPQGERARCFSLIQAIIPLRWVVGIRPTRRDDGPRVPLKHAGSVHGGCDQPLSKGLPNSPTP